MVINRCVISVQLEVLRRRINKKKDTGDGCSSESQGALSIRVLAAYGFIAGGIVDRLYLPVKDGVQC